MRTARRLAAALIFVMVMAAGAFAQVDELDTAIRDASDYLNSRIPKGSKIVVLNVQSVSTELSDYVIDELIANAVNDGFFTVVNRKQLDDIRAEQNFQASGAVDDKDALEIGRFFGAQTIVSGAVSRLGDGYRIAISALEVQTAQVQGQYGRRIASSKIINSSMGTGGGYSAVRPPAAPTAPVASTPPITGIAVPGNSLADKLAWLKRTVDSHNTYIVEVNADERIAPHTFQYDGAINITIVLAGVGGNRTIRLQSNGTMFKVRYNVTFILENNITLMGHKDNIASLVEVSAGTFIMNGGAISNNENKHSVGGGGVEVINGSFTMNNGTISGNTANSGGGVYVKYIGATFTMNGGTISGNIAKNGGGGVRVDQTFNMKGGTITGNTAVEAGGGVYVTGSAFTFNKTGGAITGYRSDPNNGNAVKDEGGNELSRKGHAVFVGAYNALRKETTSGPNSNMSYSKSTGTTGDWDN